MSPGLRHRGLTTMRALFTGNNEGSRGPVVLRVKPIPTRFPTNSLFTPMDNTYYCCLVKMAFKGEKAVPVTIEEVINPTYRFTF